MQENPFDSCWDRIDRLETHRVALSEIWNNYISDHPYDFVLSHEGAGVHLLSVHQAWPMPPTFAVEFGEWLYNARTCLDYIMWATAAHVTGHLPPPDEDTLQYPIYDSAVAWRRNEYRLKHLAPHHRKMLLQMQPFNSDLDANYLGVINRLARIDRHRRLTVSTAHLARVEPVLQLPADRRATFEWGQRMLVDGRADVARITISPWDDDVEVTINPRIGIDPEVAEWTESQFWRRFSFSERLRIIEIFLKAEVATYEYDCTGLSRKSDALTDTYRAECDERGPHGPILRDTPSDISWGPPMHGLPSTDAKFRGDDFPSSTADV